MGRRPALSSPAAETPRTQRTGFHYHFNHPGTKSQVDPRRGTRENESRGDVSFGGSGLRELQLPQGCARRASQWEVIPRPRLCLSLPPRGRPPRVQVYKSRWSAWFASMSPRLCLADRVGRVKAGVELGDRGEEFDSKECRSLPSWKKWGL